MRLLWVVGMTVVACSKSAPSAKSCERAAKLEVRAVDSDSDYMKHVFVHVGSSRDGAPTDQAAIAAGIRADIDQWQTDIVNEDNLPTETKRVTDYYLTGPDRSALEHYLTSLDAPPSDREIRYEHGKTWRTYYVVKTPIVDNGAIADVKLGKNKITEQPTLDFTLTPAGRDAFAKATAASVGKKQAFLIDGDIMMAPVINGAIKHGHFALNMPDPASADAHLAKFGCAK